MGSNTSSTVNQTSQKVRDVLLYSPVNKKNRVSHSSASAMSKSSPTLTLEGKVLKPCLKKNTNLPQNASLPVISSPSNRKTLYKSISSVNVAATGSVSSSSDETMTAPAVDIECESTCSSSSSSSSEENQRKAINTAANAVPSEVSNNQITKSGPNNSTPQSNSHVAATRKSPLQLTPIILSSLSNSSAPISSSPNSQRVQFADMRHTGSFSSLTYTNYMNQHVVILDAKQRNSPSSSSSPANSPRRFSSSSAPSSSPRSGSSSTSNSPTASSNQQTTSIMRKNLTISTASSSPSSSNGSPTHHVSNVKFQSSPTNSSSPSTPNNRPLSLFEMYNNCNNSNSPKSPSRSDSFRTHKDFSSSKSDSKSMRNLYASRFGSIFNPSLNTTIQIPLLSVTQPDAPPSYVHYPKTNRSTQYLDVR